MYPVPFGSVIVPKGHFALEDGFGTKSFDRKPYYNQCVRENIRSPSIGTQIAISTAQVRRPNKRYILQEQMIYSSYLRNSFQ